MKHTLAILVRNQPGVMTHVAGLFARRGYNIDSIAVGVTQNPDVSIITIVAAGDERTVSLLCKQLMRLPDVIEVKDHLFHESITRELALITVRADAGQRTEVLSIAEVFGAKIVDMSESTLSIEVVGNSRQIKAIIGLLSNFGIEDMARTGQIALAYRTQI
jgi:acetolactate synthase I/III small subunit